MSMTYAQLTANIEDICETSFTSDQLAMFTQQAEQAIYNTVQLPSLRKNVTGTLTSGNKYLSVPTDFLYTYRHILGSKTTVTRRLRFHFYWLFWSSGTRLPAGPCVNVHRIRIF